MRKIVALDLFAGTGWGVACKRLGIEEGGVELMAEAVATRTANGMVTLYRDVWEGLFLSAEVHALLYGIYNLLIASPPCQTFSAAGNGAGRKALGDVLEAIALEAYKDPEALRAFGEKHDPRTALVLTPLAYIWRDRPALVALEQVPTVQPVWDACAEVMRSWGYQVETRILNAEQYGVPQTRRRSILVAHLDGPVALPVPTHSRYYPRSPEKLDPGVQKWVSMAEALGWGMTDRPYLTVTGGGDTENSKHTGPPVPSALGSAASRARVASEREAGRFTWPDAPGRQMMTPSGELKMLPQELATLQSYPPCEVTYTQNNRQAHQSHRTLVHPAPTVTAGHDSSNRGFTSPDGEFRVATPEEVAVLQSYPTKVAAALADPRPDWAYNRPATTVVGSFSPGSISAPAARRSGGPSRQNTPGSIRTTPEENAALQSYPDEPPFIWCGARSKVFLQIGNAVPPLLAQHILSALVQAHEAADLI